MKNCVFRGNDASYDKILVGKVVSSKKSTNFVVQQFLIGGIVFDLNIKNNVEKLKNAMLNEKYMSVCKLKIMKNHLFPVLKI